MATKIILGISPGTRVMGFALMHKGQLVEWKVKTFKERWSRDKQNAILAIIYRLCQHYSVGILMVKKVDPLRSSPQLDMLVAAIVKQTKQMRIRVVLHSLTDLEYENRAGNKQTKEGLNEEVVINHPELKKEYLRERNNRGEYYTKMFEAIAITELHRD